VPCKHIYYVLHHVIFCGKFEIFIHFPTWSDDEVCHLLVHSMISTMKKWGDLQLASQLGF
jgi:hypothetical protein